MWSDDLVVKSRWGCRVGRSQVHRGGGSSGVSAFACHPGAASRRRRVADQARCAALWFLCVPSSAVRNPWLSLCQARCAALGFLGRSRPSTVRSPWISLCATVKHIDPRCMGVRSGTSVFRVLTPSVLGVDPWCCGSAALTLVFRECGQARLFTEPLGPGRQRSRLSGVRRDVQRCRWCGGPRAL